MREDKIVSEVYSLESVRSDLNEVLKRYLVLERKYKENMLGVDIRIILGFISGTICVILFFLFKRENLNYCKPFLCLFWGTIYADNFLSKFFFNSFFSGYNAEGKIKIITKIDPPNPFYTVLAYFGKKEIPSKVSIDIREIYNENCELNTDKFISLVSSILYSTTHQ